MPRPGNLGDMLNAWCMNHLGFKFQYAPVNHNGKYLFIGSIAQKAKDKDIIWGSGSIRESYRGMNLKANYLAVRGPRTLTLLRKQGCHATDIVGDPVLLLPRWHSRPVEKQHAIGVVPHYKDYPKVRACCEDFVINPLNSNPIQVVDQIRSCETIISSSLHGIVVAHAYGIPAKWAVWSDKVIGNGFKFYDYFDSVRMPIGKPETKIHRHFKITPPVVDLQIDLDALWSISPWNAQL